MDQQRRDSDGDGDGDEEPGKRSELTVCDIMGDWGYYQWSIALFATIYSAIAGLVVVVGPLWTPDVGHICAPNYLNKTSASHLLETTRVDFSSNPRECYSTSDSLIDFGKAEECSLFLYDDQQVGKFLTNTFDLVCSREWLRSAISSSSLLGMLLSSVTLGLLSDHYGRLACIKTGFVISISAGVLAVLAHNYLLFCIAVMLMSYAQIGTANALCTLVMESTSPRWRFVPIFEYGFGWSLGMLMAPIINNWTRNYQHFCLVLLAIQLLMLVWLKYGVFESIRWLLSEGRINQAQIELRRACRINRVRNGAELAQKIADVQMSQLRKASCVIEQKIAPIKLANSMKENNSAESQELMMLSSAIRSSFAIGNETGQANKRPSLTVGQDLEQDPRQMIEMMLMNGDSSSQVLQINHNKQARHSITTQGLIQLALSYSKRLQEEEEGKFFLVKMFHPKLYKITLVLMLLSLMLESSYYGLLQLNKFVGSNVDENYMTGALSEGFATALYIAAMLIFNRRTALMAPTLIGSFGCLGIALAYQLIPNSNSPQNAALGLTGAGVDFNSISFGLYAGQSNLTGALNGTNLSGTTQMTPELMIQFRNQLNFWLLNLAKFAITVAIQVSATIVMEAYPNNLRQTGSGAIVMVGRIGSIVSPFLFNDRSEDRTMLKLTLVAMSAIGILTSASVPLLVRDTTGVELCDRLNDIEN